MQSKLIKVLLMIAMVIATLPNMNVYAEENRGGKNDFSGWIELTTQDRDKEWTIQFDDALNEDTVTSDNIYIKDSDDNVIKTKLSISSDEKAVTIKPVVAYNPNKRYYIYVSKNIKSDKNVKLEKEINISFRVEVKDDNEPIDEEIIGYVVDKWTKSGELYVKIAIPEREKEVEYLVEEGQQYLERDENLIVFNKNSDGNIEIKDTYSDNIKMYTGIVKDKDGHFITIEYGNDDKKNFIIGKDVICYEEDMKKSVSNIHKNEYIRIVVENDAQIEAIKRYALNEKDTNDYETKTFLEDYKHDSGISATFKNGEMVLNEISSEGNIGYVVDKWRKGGDLYVAIDSYGSEGKKVEYLVAKGEEYIKKDENLIVFMKNSDKSIEIKDPSSEDIKMYTGVVKNKDDNYITVEYGNGKEEDFRVASNAICYEMDYKTTIGNIDKKDYVRIVVKNGYVEGLKRYDLDVNNITNRETELFLNDYEQDSGINATFKNGKLTMEN